MENKHIQISIIIPIFNEEKTIIQVLERISKVIKPNVTYETIVINDGSTDNTKKILKKTSDKKSLEGAFCSLSHSK